MIRSSERLDAFESQYQREAFAGLTYAAALLRFGDLWAEARALNPDWGRDWERDLEPDLAVARAVNGLSPKS